MRDVLQLLAESLRYDFIWKALLVGSLIAICCAALGVFLVLRKFSMIGDGLAHVSFATVALALLLNSSPLILSIPLVSLASLLILRLNAKANIHGDAAIGLVSSFSIALGVMISSLAKGFNVDLMSYLFGSILVISNTDVWISVVLSIVVILVVVLLYNSLLSITYDEEYATVTGLNTKALNTVMAILTSVTIVLGIRVVGTMLISSLIVFPAVSALQVAKGFKSTLLIAGILSVCCILVGVLLSYVLNIPTGATIVMLNACCFGVTFGIKQLRAG